MGGLCCCLGDNQTSSPDNPSSKTPLLSEKPGNVDSSSKPSYTQVPSYAQVATGPPRSVRQHRPDAEKERQFLTSLEQLSPVNVGDIPLPALDKTFKDHAKLYNDLLERFESLRKVIHNFKALYAKETNGIPTLQQCMAILSTNCGKAEIKAKRSKYSVQLKYDAKNVSECCRGLPEDTLEALSLYNNANNLIRQILEKISHVQDSIQLVLADEEKLRRDVTKEDLSPEVGPAALKTCTQNINNLRAAPGNLDTIKKYTKSSFNELLDSSKRFFSEHDIQC